MVSFLEEAGLTEEYLAPTHSEYALERLCAARIAVDAEVG